MDSKPLLPTTERPSTPVLSRESILERLRAGSAEIKARFGIRQVGLFGSFANQTATATSDVDLLVEFERPIGLRFVELAEHLEKLLGRPVDVLTRDGLESIRVPEVVKRIEASLVHV